MSEYEFLIAAEKANMPKIKVGDYPRYADIWVVTVYDRVFCRQFTKNENGWYAALLKNPEAHLKTDDSEFKVVGQIPAENEALSKEINQAYLKKYGRRFHPLAVVAWLMTRRKYWRKTVELVFVQ